MERSYMLNSYVKENEENLVEKETAEQHLNNLNFRIEGSKSIEEIKKQVAIFLEKNDVSTEISDELNRICSNLNEDTDVYQLEKYLENFMTNYAETKENKYNQSNETVYEIKEELVNGAIKDLDQVGIKLTGNQERTIEKIQTEDDVYKLKDNISNATEYFEKRSEIINDDDLPTLELPVNLVEEALDKPNADTVLEMALDEQEKSLSDSEPINTEIKEDGSIVIEANTINQDSLNASLMMTTMLVASENEFGIDTGLDMKIIKNKEDENKLKMVYGNFPLINKNAIDPLFASKIQAISNSYNPNINYMDVLSQKSPELAISLNLIHSHILDKKGAFQMAVKNGGKNHDIVFGMDENYADVMTAFQESGAMVSHDINENSIVRTPNINQGEQLLILSATLQNLNSKKLQTQQQNQLQNQYQKQLTYPTQMNETANVHNTFLTIIAIVEIILLTFFFYFIFK